MSNNNNNNKLICLNNLLNIIFNENNVNEEIIEKELNNDHCLIGLFLYILKCSNEFEIKKIFNSKLKTNFNSNFFNNNKEKIINNINKNINLEENFIYLLNDFNLEENNNELTEIYYNMIKFILENFHNYKNINFLKELFYFILIPKNLTLILKHFELIKIFVKVNNEIIIISQIDIENILKKNENNILCEICVLYYSFLMNSLLLCFNNMNMNNINNINNDINKNYITINEIFYNNFSYVKLYYELIYNNNNKIFEIKNLLFCLTSRLSQFFLDYNLYNEKIFNFYLNNKENNIEDLLINYFNDNNNDFDIEFWENIFYLNPYLISINTIKILCNELNNKNFNYFNLDLIFKNIFNIINNININNKEKIIIIFFKCIITIYIIFNRNIEKNFQFIESDQNKLENFILKFHTKLIFLSYDLKINFKELINSKSNNNNNNNNNNNFFNDFKDDLIKLLYDLILNHSNIFKYILTTKKNINDNLIKFLIEKIDASHISCDLFEYIYNVNRNEMDINFILNIFILFGFWANKYPLKTIYIKSRDILFTFEKVIGIQKILVNEDYENKFIKGLYLIAKAFPKVNNDVKVFVELLIKTLKEKKFRKTTIEKFEKLFKFMIIEFFENKNYRNLNTLYIECINKN